MPRSFDDTQPAEAPPVVERQPILADRSYSIILETFERRLRWVSCVWAISSPPSVSWRHGTVSPAPRSVRAFGF